MTLMQEFAYSKQAEMVVLGYAISSPAGLKSVCTTLEKKDFHPEHHQLVFATLPEAYQKGGHLDIQQLRETLKEQKSLPELSEKSYFSRVVKLFLSSEMVEECMEEVWRLSLLRDMLNRDFSFFSKMVARGSFTREGTLQSTYSLRYCIVFNNTVLDGDCVECIGRTVVIDLKPLNVSSQGQKLMTAQTNESVIEISFSD
jgi:hypothetical protein